MTDKIVNLMSLEEGARDFFEELARLKKDIPTLPTVNLKEGYGILKPYDKAIGDFTKAVRDELIKNRLDEFPDEDEKGSRYVSLSNGKRLKAEKRAKFVLDENRATEVLQEKGLLDMAVKTTYSVIDMAELMSIFNAVVDYLIEELGEKEVGESFKKDFMDNIAVTTTVDEEKVEALIKLEKLSLDDVSEFYEDKTNYALKIVK